MVQLVTFKLQSFVDLITNSSTELFQLRTSKDPEEVYEILSNFTSGFCYPLRFNLAEYRKGIKLLREQEQLCLDVDGHYDWERLREFEENTPNMEFYRTLSSWFFDREDPEHVAHAYRNYLCNSGWYYWNNKNNLDELQKRFKEFVYENNYIKNPEWCKNSLDPWFIEDIAFEEFKKTHDEISVDFLESYSNRYGDIEDLDGCIMIIGIHENSIPYEDFDEICNLFNGKSYHLG